MNPALAQLRRETMRSLVFEQALEIARNACVAGASIAAAAIGVAAFCDSPLVGVPALRVCMARLAHLELTAEAWRRAFRRGCTGIERQSEPAPGFGYVNAACAANVRAACRRILTAQQRRSGGRLTRFFLAQHTRIDRTCGALNPIGLMALVFVDEGVVPARAERHFLYWHIRRALVEAQRSSVIGTGRFPLLSELQQYEGTWPEPHQQPTRDYRREIGLTGSAGRS